MVRSDVWVEVLAVFISIMAVIYTTVVINRKQAAYFSCVVFLSIVINHIGDTNPYRFVWNRFLDTMIGICIGILVNNIRICLNPDVISPDTANELNELIQKSGFYPYINVIIDDTLLIYYQDMSDEVNCHMTEKLKTSPYRNYLKREFPRDENVVYFMLLGRTEKIEAFYKILLGKGYDKRFKILKYASDDYKGYSYIKIYNKNASKENMLLYLKEKYDIEKIMTFGTIPDKYDVFVGDGSFNEMVRQVRRRYEPFLKG